MTFCFIFAVNIEVVIIQCEILIFEFLFLKFDNTAYNGFEVGNFGAVNLVGLFDDAVFGKGEVLDVKKKG